MTRFTSGALAALGLALMVLAMAGCFEDDDCEEVPVGTGAPEVDSPGYRNPDTGTCDYIGPGPGGGGGNCGDFGGSDLAEPAPLPDYAICFGGCEGLDEATCTETPSCRAIYVSDCPANADCDETVGYSFADCWGTAPASPDPNLECAGLDAYQCSRSESCSARHGQNEVGGVGPYESCVAESTTGGPGSCVGEPACDTLPPDCPADTVPGRDADCWTGFCIPLDECDEIPACDSLDEQTCIESRSDCGPSYRGEDCTCDAVSCTCTTLVFTGCGAL